MTGKTQTNILHTIYLELIIWYSKYPDKNLKALNIQKTRETQGIMRRKGGEMASTTRRPKCWKYRKSVKWLYYTCIKNRGKMI